MKVVFIGPFAFYPKGTVGVRIFPLAKVLRENGHEVAILLPPYDNPDHSGRSFKVGGIEVYNVSIPKTRLPIKYLYVAVALVKKTLELRPDVVHIFKPKGYSGLSGIFWVILKFLRLTRLPLVVDSDDWEGYGGFADYYLAHGVYSKAMVDFFDFQERWLIRHADVVTVASRALESRALNFRKGLDHDSVFYVPNGPSELPKNSEGKTSAEIRKGLGVEDKQVILLWTRFFEYDVKEVIEILARVVSEIADVRLLVMGRGEFHEEVKLLELAKERGLIQHLDYVGWVRLGDIRGYIEASDVAIYPFRDDLLNRSKCPVKLVQLLGLGKAVVADSVGQISEYIEHGKSGMLVEPGDTEEFARFVIELLRNRKLREMLGEGAKRRIWKEFNWKKLARNLKYAYKLTGYL